MWREESYSAKMQIFCFFVISVSIEQGFKECWVCFSSAYVSLIMISVIYSYKASEGCTIGKFLLFGKSVGKRKLNRAAKLTKS